MEEHREKKNQMDRPHLNNGFVKNIIDGEIEG
jgi:hypothetical protein